MAISRRFPELGWFKSEVFERVQIKKNFKFRLDWKRLKSWRQDLNEPVETYFYDVMSLCKQIEEETGTKMSEIN